MTNLAHDYPEYAGAAMENEPISMTLKEYLRMDLQRKVLLAACAEALEYFEDCMDIRDSDHGPKPNREMQMFTMLQEAIARASK